MIKHQITAEEFQTQVRRIAHEYWKREEGYRRHCNWMDAIKQLTDENQGGFPIPEAIRCRAHQLWLERKDAQAREDWCRAEVLQRQHFEVTSTS